MASGDMMVSTAAEFGGEKHEGTKLGLNVFLSLPDVVKETLLIKIAESGPGEILKFRSLCKTTKSWVDESSPPRAKIMFSRLQVSMNLDVETVERFLETPPPFMIPDLSVNICKLRKTDKYEPVWTPHELLTTGFAALTLNSTQEGNPETGQGPSIPPKESVEMWNKFCDFWMPRLVSLQIRKADVKRFISRPHANQETATVIRKLLDSPNLDKVNFMSHFQWVLVPPFPASFHKLSEISTGPMLRWPTPQDSIRGFYLTLRDNPNLKKVSLEFNDALDVECIQMLAEKNKNNRQFQLSLKNGNLCDMNEAHDAATVPAFSRLVHTLVKCEFQTKLKLRFYQTINDFFQTTKDQLETEDYLKFLNFFESLSSDKHPQVYLVELQSLEGLHELTLDRMIRGTQLRFPPNLVKLKYGKGFPRAIGNLPLCLKELNLNQFFGSLDELGESLSQISAQCVNLERLKLTWFSSDNPGAEQSFIPAYGHYGCNEGREDHYAPHAAINFRALKSLSLKGYDQNQDIVRELLLYRLGLDQMPLLHLAMSFHSRVTWRRFFRDDEEDVGLQPDPDHPDMIPAEIANNPQHQAFIERAIAQDGTYSCLMDNLLELIDGEILSRMCDGPLGRSLLFMEIPKETVFPDGFAAFERLKTYMSANLKNREELEGRGQWLYQYPLQYDYYHG